MEEVLKASSESASEEAARRAAARRLSCLDRLGPEPPKPGASVTAITSMSTSTSSIGEGGGGGSGGSGVVTVCFRLPPRCGIARLERRFAVDASVGALLDFLGSRPELEGVDWELRQTAPVIIFGGAPPGGSGSSSSGGSESGSRDTPLSSLGLGSRALLLVFDRDS